MSTLELSGLEYQVDHLIRSLEQLKAENYSLQQRLARSLREQHTLQEKNRKTVTNIKKIISRLKEGMA